MLFVSVDKECVKRIRHVCEFGISVFSEMYLCGSRYETLRITAAAAAAAAVLTAMVQQPLVGSCLGG
jgi:hypothetical protein